MNFDIDDQDKERIKRQSLEHYRRMIEWVRTKDLSHGVSFFLMGSELAENWGAKSCSYCSSYHFCKECPLSDITIVYEDYTKNAGSCCDGLWSAMSDSKTWSDWLYYAEQIYNYIEEKG